MIPAPRLSFISLRFANRCLDRRIEVLHYRNDDDYDYDMKNDDDDYKKYDN